ncbi:MAG TPA: type II toxin-antitoxin system PemK/MazF family toxin [Chthoniobacterales bacterium]|nr:type II toxin-antitoxin system PemK/MazF family toxin [Chthoniobacterales bacterium]
MVKPVAGEVVAIPFPRTDPAGGKRRPALVIADLPGADLILCQITSRAHSDAFSIPLDSSDFKRGQLGEPCFIRPQRLFTVEHHIILSSIGKVQAAKLGQVLKKARAFFD